MTNLFVTIFQVENLDSISPKMSIPVPIAAKLLAKNWDMSRVLDPMTEIRINELPNNEKYFDVAMLPLNPLTAKSIPSKNSQDLVKGE